MIEYSYNNGNLLDKSNKTCQFYDINEKEYSHHFIISDSQGNILY